MHCHFGTVRAFVQLGILLIGDVYVAAAELVAIPPANPFALEWTYHKTDDGVHPNGPEQQMLWLLNRARQDPSVEGRWLAGGLDSMVTVPSEVDLAVLIQEFDSYQAKAPAAFDVRLYEAARQHSLDMIARNAQDHLGQFEDVTKAGFYYKVLRGNVFSWGQSGLHAHAAFNVDWGSNSQSEQDSGMQTGRGHRISIMSIDADYSSVGLAAIPASGTSISVGPLVITENFAVADTTKPDHFKRFFVGTVWADRNHNHIYDPGEGMAGIRVDLDRGNYFATTGQAGGYAVPIFQTGAYQVVFRNVDKTVLGQKSVVAAGTSVLVDLKYPVLSGTLVFIRLSGNKVIISWSGGNAPYQVQGSESLTAGTWTNVGPLTTNNSVELSIVNQSSFYRVVGN